ncbi:hypothetical protein BIY45_07460 [Stenotrophomonas sp. BIIR7]|nr:hypothetical protein BIY45_07460 [Stenotrophomonas sp. BIIR7]
MRRSNARARKDLQALDPPALRRVVLSLFRRRNDYGSFDVSGVINQLRGFGVENLKQFRLLMKKHRRSILVEERRKMPRAETLHLLETSYPNGVDSHSNTSWYAVTGLVRQALCREFGDDRVFPEAEGGG